MCPLVDRGDRRCDTHLTLRNLTTAFTHCADRYTSCPLFREIVSDADADAPHKDKSECETCLLAGA